MSAKSILTITIVGLLLIVAFQNMNEIVLRVLFWEIVSPQLVVLLLVFLLGAGVGALIGRSRRKRAANEPNKPPEPDVHL